jgi:ribonuclease R
VHRQLSQLLETGRPVPPRDFEAVNEGLAVVATHSSERERRAEAAERESLLWKKIVFMKDKLGREFDAFVTGVTSFGVFVTLRDFFVEGLVPMSSLGDDFYVYEEKQHRLRGHSSGRIFRLGDPVSVELKAIDEVRRRLDFRIAGERARSESAPTLERVRTRGTARSVESPPRSHRRRTR